MMSSDGGGYVYLTCYGERRRQRV